MPAAYVWSATSDASTALLHHPQSRWSALVSRPPADRLPIESLTRLEPLAFSWGDLLQQSTTQATLERWLATEPLTVLHGLNWLIAFWAVHWSLRSGSDAGDRVRSLDYTGPWRDPDDPESDRVWAGLTDRLRLGVLAELTGNAQARQGYDAQAKALGEPTFLKVTLITIDGLVQDLRDEGLHLEGATAALARHTTAPSNGAAPPFSRPYLAEAP